MTVAPFVIALVVGLIIILAIATVCFGLAWRKAELDACDLRRQRANRVIGMPNREAL